jgi:hypothetical protein
LSYVSVQGHLAASAVFLAAGQYDGYAADLSNFCLVGKRYLHPRPPSPVLSCLSKSISPAFHPTAIQEITFPNSTKTANSTLQPHTLCASVSQLMVHTQETYGLIYADEISDSRGGEYEDDRLLGYSTV